jgi:hypothetical protein
MNVAWLQLKNLEGTLAGTVYRVDTSLGQPSASCNASTDTTVLAVPYSAKYCQRLDLRHVCVPYLHLLFADFY